MSLDARKNFSITNVKNGYSLSDTSIEVINGSLFPDPAVDGEFNLIWWNFTDYKQPSDDPYVEIVRCTARVGNILTVERATEATTASNKNKSGRLYKIMLGLTSKVLDDINNGINSKEPVLPVTPENPETKFLNGNRQWKDIAIGAGGFAGNLYFTNQDSNVTGYKKISYINDIAEVELNATINNQELLLRTYLYDTGIETDVIDAGVWIANYRAKVSGTMGITQLKFELFVRHIDNTETTLFSSYSPELNNTEYLTIRTETNQPLFNVSTTDRLGVRIYGKTTANNNITISTIIGDGNASYFTTPLAIRHSQLRNLNGDNNYLHVTSSEKTSWNKFSKSINLYRPTSTGKWKIGRVNNNIIFARIDIIPDEGMAIQGRLVMYDSDGFSNRTVICTTPECLSGELTTITNFDIDEVDSGKFLAWEIVEVFGSVKNVSITLNANIN